MTLHTHRYSPEPIYSLQILTENDNNLIEGGTRFTVRYPQEFSDYHHLRGNEYRVPAQQQDGNLYVSFNEHHSDVLRASRILEQVMYSYRGDLTPPSCTLLVHCEGDPTRTFRGCMMSSVQYGASVDIMEIECNWLFRECDFRGGILTDEIQRQQWTQRDAYFALLGRQEQLLERQERVDWMRLGF